jgi:hypothetical protein
VTRWFRCRFRTPRAFPSQTFSRSSSAHCGCRRRTGLDRTSGSSRSSFGPSLPARSPSESSGGRPRSRRSRRFAHSAAGLRLAVAHARMGAFETGQENAGALRPLAERLQSERALDLPGRAYRLRLYPGLLPKLLRRYRDRAACAAPSDSGPWR